MNAPLMLMGEEGQAQGPGGWRLYIRTKRSSTGTVTSSQSTGVQGRQSTTVTVGMVSHTTAFLHAGSLFWNVIPRNMSERLGRVNREEEGPIQGSVTDSVHPVGNQCSKPETPNEPRGSICAPLALINHETSHGLLIPSYFQVSASVRMAK